MLIIIVKKANKTNSTVRFLICFTAQYLSLNPKVTAFTFLNHYLEQACLSCIPHIDGSLRKVRPSALKGKE